MDKEFLVIAGLAAIMGLVLALPFFYKKIEQELEGFLFVMGVIAVSISGVWSWHLLEKASVEPIPISIAVFVAGFLFEKVRMRLTAGMHSLVEKWGIKPVLFVFITVLGLVSSLTTAIIAGLILAEVTSTFRVVREARIKITVIGCYAIGLGAVLTPIGEPLSTIAISKLSGEPYHAGVGFLFNTLGWWVIPLVIGFGALCLFLISDKSVDTATVYHKGEQIKDIAMRAVRTYVFVMALVFLGTGIEPATAKFVTRVPPMVLYWINIISAALDNATLTAGEITPAMSLMQIKYMLLSLLISGGMLIPGNIPNIICAGKLQIRSKEWAVFAVPVGLIAMVLVFVLLWVTEVMQRGV